MTTPTAFMSRTARFDLPLLFAGQAQKEFTVNEALSRVASLLHPVVIGEQDAPPPSPAEGEAWLVGNAPTGKWAGYTAAIACWSAGEWLFIHPQMGLRCFDTETGSTLFYDGEWQRPELPATPLGGATQDAEARTAIALLIRTMEQAGIA